SKVWIRTSRSVRRNRRSRIPKASPLIYFGIFERNIQSINFFGSWDAIFSGSRAVGRILRRLKNWPRSTPLPGKVSKILPFPKFPPPSFGGRSRKNGTFPSSFRPGCSRRSSGRDGTDDKNPQGPDCLQGRRRLSCLIETLPVGQGAQENKKKRRLAAPGA